MQAQMKECTPTCKQFRCDKKPSAFQIRNKGNKKILWCTWVDDECDGPYCKFGICLERRMTDDYRCKSVSNTQQTYDEYADDFVDPGYIPKEIEKKIKKK